MWNGVRELQTLIIIAHPDHSNSNTQRFFIESCDKMEQVKIHYLKEELSNKKKEQEILKKYDRIIFQFPMYWYSAPFILKKWLDDIFDDEFTKNSLKDKELGLVVTLGRSLDDFASGRSEKFTLSEIFRPFEALANKCQMKYLPIFPVALFSYLSEQEKKKLLIDYQMYLTKENDASFKSKEEWFIDRMHQRQKSHGEQLSSLNHVIESLEDNRENLEELLILVKEMRRDDE